MLEHLHRPHRKKHKPPQLGLGIFEPRTRWLYCFYRRYKCMITGFIFSSNDVKPDKSLRPTGHYLTMHVCRVRKQAYARAGVYRVLTPRVEGNRGSIDYQAMGRQRMEDYQNPPSGAHRASALVSMFLAPATCPFPLPDASNHQRHPLRIPVQLGELVPELRESFVDPHHRVLQRLRRLPKCRVILLLSGLRRSLPVPSTEASAPHVHRQ